MLTNERLTNTTHEELGGAIHNLHGHHPLREGSKCDLVHTSFGCGLDGEPAGANGRTQAQS